LQEMEFVDKAEADAEPEIDGGVGGYSHPELV
jgi:hypothetical protein